MNYKHIVLKRNREIPVLKGHPWIFSGALASIENGIVSGDVVCVTTGDGRKLGLGFFNDGNIAVRLLTNDSSAVIDDDFWRRRLRQAIYLRAKILPPGTDAYRLVNAEGDGMPGLIVDRYRDCFVFSIQTAGMERWRDTLIRLFVDELKPRNLYERSEGVSRQREGLSDRIGAVIGDISPVVDILENGLSFEVDIASGQKTGFFLDQRSNREIIRRISRGAFVLNCFSYTGAFSVYAAVGGARRVISVDSSRVANEITRKNILRNGLEAEEHPVITSNCFDYLRKTTDIFDLVILDPPAFAKSRTDVTRAVRAYREINLQAARHISEGGILASFSCSNHVDEELFREIVLAAVLDAGKIARTLFVTGAGADHPVGLGHPEGRYLKGLFVSITKP